VHRPVHVSVTVFDREGSVLFTFARAAGLFFLAVLAPIIFLLWATHNQQVVIRAGKGDLPLVVICTDEDEICLDPVPWVEAKQWEVDYAEAGVVLFVEGTPAYQAAIDYINEADPDKAPTWTTLMIIAGF